MKAARQPQTVVSSTADWRKRPREPTADPQDSVAKKLKVERTKASTKEEEWVEVPTRQSLRKQEPKPEAKNRSDREVHIQKHAR